MDKNIRKKEKNIISNLKDWSIIAIVMILGLWLIFQVLNIMITLLIKIALIIIVVVVILLLLRYLRKS